MTIEEMKQTPEFVELAAAAARYEAAAAVVRDKCGISKHIILETELDIDRCAELGVGAYLRATARAKLTEEEFRALASSL